MQRWLKRIRGAIGMGLTWAVGWALCGVLIGVTSILLPGLPWASFFDVFDAPLPALAVPGFVGDVLLSLVPAAFVVTGLGTAAPGLNLWRTTFAIMGPLALLSALSAAGSLMLARKGQRRHTPDPSEDMVEVR